MQQRERYYLIYFKWRVNANFHRSINRNDQPLIAIVICSREWTDNALSLNISSILIIPRKIPRFLYLNFSIHRHFSKRWNFHSKLSCFLWIEFWFWNWREKRFIMKLIIFKLYFNYTLISFFWFSFISLELFLGIISLLRSFLLFETTKVPSTHQFLPFLSFPRLILYRFSFVVNNKVNNNYIVALFFENFFRFLRHDFLFFL